MRSAASSLLPCATLCALLCAALGGCAGASLGEKADSFRPYEGLVVGGEPLARFVGRRTAVLLREHRVLRVQASRSRDVLRIVPAADASGMGTAAAITSDGYFLTAAHNIGAGTLHLVLRLPDGRVAVGAARTVWVGDPDEPGQDFALLRLGATPAGVAWFQWAPLGSIRDGTPLVAAGALRPAASPAYAGGQALGDARPPAGSPPAGVVLHDVPLRPGDSGGPLVTLDGRLVGLNVIYAPLTGRNIAVRPDPTFVQRLIDDDRRAEEERLRRTVAVAGRGR